MLHIESSPRKQRSHSLNVARTFLDAYRASHPADTVTTLDLWSHSLPELGDDILEAKYAVMHGREHTHAQAAAWEAVKAEFAHLASADRILISVPMWNFGIPYRLKHFIDVVTQPGLAFEVSSDGGYRGLLAGKSAAVIYARGGEYAEGTPAAAYDQQRPYVEQWLGFVGIEKIGTIVVEPTLGDPHAVAEGKARALEQARHAGQRF